MRAAERILIAAQGAGQLARAASAAGYRVLVIDAYADQDTVAAAERCIAVDVDEVGRWRIDEVTAAIHELQRQFGPLPLLWGSGWEPHAHVLMALAARGPLLGSGPESLLALADPNRLSRLLDDEDVQVAAAVFARDPNNTRWLEKNRRRAGGLAVQPARRARFAGAQSFFQPLINGTSCSAVFVGEHEQTTLLGVCEHFSVQSSARHPYRQSGAVTVEPAAFITEQLQRVAERLARCLPLRGLFGIDFIRPPDDRIVILELNSRPTATFALHLEPALAIDWHIQAGELRGQNREYVPRPTEATGRVRACATIYADDPIRITKPINWPAWVSDRPQRRGLFDGSEPLCTIWSTARDPRSAQQQLHERHAALLDVIAGV